MKDTKPVTLKQWESLLSQAQMDKAPLTDQPALLSVVRSASQEEHGASHFDLTVLFSPRRFIPAFLVSTGACLATIAWQLHTLWQTLPWAQLLMASRGGGL